MHDKVLHLTVIKYNATVPGDMNMYELVDTVALTCNSDDELIYPDAVDYSESICHETQ